MKNRVKKAFTLFELIIVIVIISTAYILMFSNSSFSVNKEKSSVNLVNLKNYLLKKEFQNRVSFVCVSQDLLCYVKIDGKVEEKFQNFFTEAPEVYKYQKEEKKIEFVDEKIKNDKENVVFKFEINRDFKSDEFIVDTMSDKGVFVFNSIHTNATAYESLSMAFEQFDKKEQEVKDAF